MSNKQFKTCRSLVQHVLESQHDTGKTLAQFKNDSQNGIVKFYQNEIIPLSHLCTRPVTFQSVNRYVEMWIKTRQANLNK